MRFCNSLVRGSLEMSTNMEQIDWNHWLLRLVAFIIDSIIVSIVSFILLFIAAVATIVTGAFYARILYLLLLACCRCALHNLLHDLRRGLGRIHRKNASWDLKVQTVNGGKVSFDKALIRNISKFYGLVILDWIIAIATPGKDKRQKWTDRIAGTTVVQTKQPFQSITQPSPTPGTPPPPPPPA